MGSKNSKPTDITVKHKDGTEIDYTVTRFPWHYSTYTVIDQTDGVMLYVPTANIEGIEVRNSSYSQAVPA